MGEQPPAGQQEKLSTIAAQIAKGVLEATIESNIGKRITAESIDGLGALVGLGIAMMAPIGVGFAKAIATSEDIVAPQMADVAAAAVSDIFGTDIPASTFSQKRNRDGRQRASDTLGAGVLNAIRGNAGAVEPSEAGAQRYLGFVINMALEGWYQGWMLEFLTSMVPQVQIGNIESFAGLDDVMSQTLGLGRMSRSVIRPLLDATVVTPLKWQVNKTYRPELLSTGLLSLMYARGAWSFEKVSEELARQGYSDDRIAALLTQGLKYHSAADLDLLVRSGQYDPATATDHLRNQGWLEHHAQEELDLEKLKRIASFERAMANAAVSAFADGRIGEAMLGEFTTGATIDAQEKAQLVELAHARSILGRRPLTSGEAEQAVKAGILSMSDYRRALVREGRDDEAVVVLELLLRRELDKASDIEDLKKRQAAERAAEKQARDAAMAARKAEVEKERALRRRGAEADLERAVVRGLVPIVRLEELYVARYDPDTVRILLELVTDDRLAYVAQQQKRIEAEKRVPVRRAELGDLEAAVMANVLSLAEFRTRLAQLHFDAADAALLADTLAARKADADFAKAKRAQAEEAAKIRRVNLGTFEQLVRRGHRSLADYGALLEDLGFDVAAVAAMRELLQLQIDDDARARAERAAAEARLKIKGLSIEQLRRAVLLKVKTIDDYQAFLVEQGFTTDAQLVLLAELRADVAEADAARQRRDAAERARREPAISVGDVARAARLGLIPMQVYIDRLTRDGYSADDIAIETDLLVHEMADIAAQRERRERAEAAAREKGLSLADVARQVKAKLVPIGAYTSAAIGAGFTAAAADALTELLAHELATIEAAARRRAALAEQLPERDLALGQFEAAVVGDLMSLDDFFANVVGLGYDEDEAALLRALLVVKLEAKAAAAGGAEGE